MTIYSQQDPKWKNTKLGQDSSETTIGQSGCFLTCFSMILDTPPDVVNQRVKTFGGFVGADICPGVVPNAYKNIYLESTVWCSKTPAPMDLIDKALENDKPVIVQLDTSPAEGIQSHFVILTKKISANDYEMLDPWPLVDIPRGTVITRYGKDKNGLPRKIEEVICYVAVIGGVKLSEIAGPVVEEVNPPATEQTTEYGDVIQPLFADSRLRTGAGLSAPIVCKLPAGIKLNRNTAVTIVKDGYRWGHIDGWVALESVDGKNKYFKSG